MIGLGFVVAAGVGTVVRWRLGSGVRYPWLTTLAVNLIGSFGLGLLAGASRDTALLVGVAGFGSLTTFSTLIAELFQLHEEAPPKAWALGAVSLALGVGAAWLGLSLA